MIRAHMATYPLRRPERLVEEKDAQQCAVDRQHVIERRGLARPHPAHPFVPGQVRDDRGKDPDVDRGQHHRETQRRRTRPPLQGRGQPKQGQTKPC